MLYDPLEGSRTTQSRQYLATVIGMYIEIICLLAPFNVSIAVLSNWHFKNYNCMRKMPLDTMESKAKLCEAFSHFMFVRNRSRSN